MGIANIKVPRKPKTKPISSKYPSIFLFLIPSIITNKSVLIEQIPAMGPAGTIENAVITKL